MVAGEPVMELAAVRREQHAEALAFDIAGEQLANFRIVVDDENALRGGGHRPWGEEGLRSLLTSPWPGHERIFVAKTSGLCCRQRFDTKFIGRATFGHTTT
jgi:hypothetical protein